MKLISQNDFKDEKPFRCVLRIKGSEIVSDSGSIRGNQVWIKYHERFDKNHVVYSAGYILDTETENIGKVGIEKRLSEKDAAKLFDHVLGNKVGQIFKLGDWFKCILNTQSSS